MLGLIVDTFFGFEFNASLLNTDPLQIIFVLCCVPGVSSQAGRADFAIGFSCGLERLAAAGPGIGHRRL
ncbi:MAG: hypothetical protein HKN35_05075, partial [Woeseia sp.]|nr:hypothetical protein [Woeseia sp.]